MCDDFQQPDRVGFCLPAWLAEYIDGRIYFDTLQARMSLVIDASRLNVRFASGGPFAAAVFERDSGRLVSLGVNRVIPEGLSLLHAEMVALSLAQRQRGGYDLGAEGLPAHQLVCSSEPCAMCFGAVCWAGVRDLVTGARAADVRAIGFDEGPKPDAWVAALQQRGIHVTRDLLRDEAIQVLHAYQAQGGERYNSRGE
jgi:tRNA(Arg) A34 adenosine deaminase TadA